MLTATERGATGIISRWITAQSSRRCADLPEAVRKQATRALLNCLGCSIGGAGHSARAIWDQVLGESCGPPHATILGTPRRAGAIQAALANALSATVDAFCDTHAEAIIHPSAPVVTAALALAEQRHSSGESLLLAIVLGIEIECRLSKAISVAPARASFGWLQTGIGGGVGAAVAAGSLLGLDARQMAQAIGIAASQAGGLRISMGTYATPLVHAQGAETGLRAALLVAAGFTGPENVIEGEFGFAQMFCAEPALSHLTEGLGERYELLSLTYKAYPCGIVAHAAIDAALELQAKGVDAASIERLEARVHPSAVKLTGRQHPRDSNEAQFSLQHWAAVALIHGTARVADGSPARLAEPAVVALRARVEAIADPALASDAAAMTAVLRNGERVEASVAHCTGSAARPMSDADVETKFRGLAEGQLSGERMDNVISLCREILSVADVSTLAVACAKTV